MFINGKYRLVEAADSAGKCSRWACSALDWRATFELNYNQVASPTASVLTARWAGQRNTLEDPGAGWEGTVSVEAWQE